MNLCYASLKLLFKTYRAVFSQDCLIFNADRIPHGAKIFAANHPNVTDTIHLALAIKEQLNILIMGDLFSIPVLGWLLDQSGQIPVYPGQNRAALQKTCETLSAGGSVLIYPEAKLNPENRRLKGKTGAVRLSLTSGAPIIPLGIYVPSSCIRTLQATYNGRPRQGHWQTTGFCTLYFGEPWRPSNEIHAATHRSHIYSLTDQLMGKIYDLSQNAYQEWLRDRPTLSPLYSWQNSLIDRQRVEDTW